MKNQDLLQKFANLPSEKRAQIMAQLQAQGFDLATPTQPTSDNGASVQTSRAIPKVDRTTPIPLSFPQERLWFLHQLEPDSTSYNSPVLLRLTGQPDVAALEASFRYLITRHESLRTTFVKENHDGEATQMIHPPSWATQFVLVPTPVESAKMAEELAQEETMTLFDLGDGPLLRVRLFQIATDEFLLFFSIHHIISDAWSLSIFMQELTHAYRAYGAGQQPTLPDLPIQYADFAAWQRQWMTTDYLKPQLEYWKAQLGGTLPTLDLPLDFPRPRQQTVSGGMHHVTLSKELSQSLRVLSQHHDATLFMTLLAAFNLLLARLSGQDDILIGTPMAGRSQAEVEGLIGLFLNTLVLRTDLSGDPTFTALLGSVKQTVLDAHKHQDVPFEKLVEELHPERDLSRAPIFQVFFNMPPQTQPAEWPHVQTEFYERLDAESKFDLTFYIEDGAEGEDGGIRITAVYNRQLFTPERMEMMIEQYHHLLTQLSQDATGSLRTYSLVTPVMQQTILPDLRQPIPEPSYDLVPTVIADWAIQTPQQIALEQGHETWTYHEMVTFAQGVAQMLQTQSLSKGDVVAIWSGNCPQLIATILGTWLAGHPFLILDPKLPRQRWQVLLEASQASACILIGDTADKESDKDTEAVHMWLNEHCPTVLSIHESTQMPSAAMSESQCGPDDAAYIFFTSGTTGVPKGVRGTHKGLAHFLDWQRNTFAVQPTDRVAQLTSLSFDVVLRAIFLPLVSGATLVLPETSDIILSGEAVLPWLDAKKITITHIVPSLAKAWLANRDDTATLETMKLLFFAGEPLTSQLVTQWRNTFPHSGEIVNLYGPTETTLAKCFYRVPQDVLPGIQPVGRPQPDTHVVVMNQGRVCGVGEVGEIVIRTPFRTQGYINVKHTFSQNPFTDHSDDLLYYTGDAGRIRPNGLIDILGRLDRQVKIRGVRIELGEIENALLQHPHVKEAVVIIHENSEEDKRLVAYVVEKLKGGKVEGTDTNPSTLQLFNSSTLQPFNPSTLRQHLAQQLPDSMIPSAFVFLDAIPLTTNGKLDRRALPVPGYTEIQSEFVAPRTEMEAAVAAIWQSVLHVEQVGVNDSFFALGGHSLLATQVISQVRSQLNLDIPLKSLFEASQLGDFAQVVNQAISQTQQSTDERIVPVSREQPLPLSFSQQRLWFLDQLEPDSAFYNIPILLRLTGQLDVAVLEASFRYLIERHESLRTIFRTETSTQANAGESVQVIHPPSWASQFMLTVTPVVDEHQAYHLAHVEATTPFDLGEGPLLRVLLSSIADNDAALSLPKRHLLVLNMHHIISDVWSMGVLVKELTHAYRAYIAGQQPTLPDLPIQYADFAVWQRDYLSAGTAGARLETQRDYWRKQLADAPALLELPTDRPRPPVMSYRGAHYAFELSADLTAKLNQLAQTHDATLFMVLLTAFNILLSRYSRQDDIVVGSPIANRNRAEIEGLIGFFVNNLVLRTQLAGNPSFTELLAQVRQTTLDAYQHQDLPFEQLVDALDLERTLSYSPLFQVTLVLQNAEIGEFDLPNLTATMQPADFPFAKSDLRFILTEQGKAGNLWGLMEYATDLFDEATIARMMSHFTVLLESIVNEESLGVQQPIHQLPILTEDEVHQIVYEWNDTTVVFGEPQTIQALFEQQVARTPNAIALIFAEDSEMGRWGDGEMGRQGDRESVTITLSYHHTPTPSHPHTLTYAELNTRANQLAHHLIELGVQADTLVAVAMERSVEMVVSLLAVLKAGGAYVPIDPNYPEERIRYMLDDSAAPILLTQSHLPLAQFTEHGGVADSARQSMHVLAVDMMATALAVQPSHTPQTKTSTNDLAYVIYTSGSTGQPKGVMIEHGGAFNVAMTQAEVLPTLTTGSRLLQMASLSFDAATFEFMLALMHGVTLVVSSPHHERVGSALADLLQQQCITHVTLVPSVLQTLPQVDLPDLKVLITAGEACSPALVNQWGAGRTFFNLYGPTESPIWTTYALLQPNQPVHIGQPVPNRQVYILNDVGAIAPTGVAGELHIGGTQLARGYLNRPDLTVERFIDHPEFGRLYKTGDLCRWTASGAIEFLGRTDFQVKLRGFRIELGEIENALLAQDGVREAVVLAREEDSDKRLVAYLVGDGETGRQRDGETGRQEFQPSTFQPFNLSTLRSSLEQQLPDYMIPSAFVFLEAMPLTANGKLDRRALPAPEYVDTQIEFVAPHTETETVLATVWSELLGIEPIGIHHNFFELGGHSLLATQVASRIQAAFQISLPLRSIFEAPTLTDLASIVDSQHADAKLIQELRYGEINSDTHGATLGNDQPAEEKPAEEKLAEVTMVEGRL